MIAQLSKGKMEVKNQSSWKDLLFWGAFQRSSLHLEFVSHILCRGSIIHEVLELVKEHGPGLEP